MTDPAARARALLEKDQFACHTGITLDEVGPGHARATLHVRPEHFNGAGSVQGGVFFTLADFAFAAASNGTGTLAVAASAHIAFFRAVTGGTLVADALEVHAGKTLGTYRVEVRDDSGELVALFTGTAFRKGTPLPAPPGS